jgi:siroheme synthase-like protein
MFPVFLKLDRRRVVVVGGGRVAAAKVRALVAARARVTVVAPRVHPAIVRAKVRTIRRAFRPRDLDGAWFVVAAASPAVNRRVAAAARARRVFVNAVDDPRHASAYLGGVVRRGRVVVAISTSGDAPALAGLVREALEALLPRALDRWRETAKRLRAGWRRRGVPLAARRPLLVDALVRLYARRPRPSLARGARGARRALSQGA